MNELALFAGAGGGILGGHLLGWRTVCAVEVDPYPASVLVARQNDGILPTFPVWDDVCTFDGRPWRGLVDVVSGGFPCQDISSAGKGAGIDGDRSGLWAEMARIISEVRPRFAFMENSPMLVGRGLTRVLSDLAEMGYDAVWHIIGADDVGANHVRKRIWILAKPKAPEVPAGSCGNGMESGDDVADSNGKRHGAWGKKLEANPPKWTQGDVCSKNGSFDVPHAPCERCGEEREFRRQQSQERASRSGVETSDPESKGLEGYGITCGDETEKSKLGVHCENATHSTCERWEQMEQHDSGGTEGEGADCEALQCHFDPGQPGWWEAEPDVDRVVNGMAARVDMLKAIGNGQVPLVAAVAFDLLMRRMEGREA